MPCAPTETLDEAVEINDDQGETEIEPVKIAPSPVLPSAPEVEEHRVTHAQYRSWCRECVEGKALGEQRGRASDDGVITMQLEGDDGAHEVVVDGSGVAVVDGVEVQAEDVAALLFEDDMAAAVGGAAAVLEGVMAGDAGAEMMDILDDGAGE